MRYDRSHTVNLDYRGYSIAVEVHYELEPPSGFSDDPWGSMIWFGKYHHPKRGKPLSDRLHKALEKEYENHIAVVIFDHEGAQ